jgi:hypothetical protein
MLPLDENRIENRMKKARPIGLFNFGFNVG